MTDELPPRAKLRPDEVAKYLRVSRATVYELVNAGVIPSQRVGRQIRIPRDKFIEWDRAAPSAADL